MSKLQGLGTLLVGALLVALAISSGHGAYLVGAVVFFVALLVSVVLHEAGHFLTARHYGMKATQFFVGFGPTLFSRRRGETEYGVKAVPAGGFVKIIGMTPLEELEPGDEPRAFFRFPPGQKTVVLAAGSTMHFIIAGVLVLGGILALGVPQEISPSVGRLADCVASDPGPGKPDVPADRVCALPDARPAPAKAAGLQVGDIVTAVDGKPLANGRDLTLALRAAADQPVRLDVRRAGATVALDVVPAAISRVDLQDATKRVSAGTIGISVQQRQDVVHEGLGPSLSASGNTLKLFGQGIVTTVTSKLGSITKIYSPNRDPEGFIGIVGAGRISGQVLEQQESWGFKALNLVLIVASLNLFVGLFNLLPLLPLDGGHIAVVWFESARDKLRRARGYAGPIRRVDYNKLLPITYGVAGTFLIFTLLLVGADIVNPVRLPS